MALADGMFITGFDFGRVHNQIVACRLCTDSSHEDKGRIVDWAVIDYGNKATLVNVIKKLRKHLDTNPVFDADYFMLERQSPKNAFCYGLSHVLYYALLQIGRGKPQFVAPTHKFAVLDPVTSRSTKVTYRSEKRRAIRLCNILIINQPCDVTDPYRCAKKKDDYADAFLYARAFLETRGTKIEKPCHV